jgi:hypothetical protein
MRQDADRTQEAFQTSSASQESNIHLASANTDGKGNEAGTNYQGPNMLYIFLLLSVSPLLGGEGSQKFSFTGDRNISQRLWLQHDNAKQDASLKTRESITKFG